MWENYLWFFFFDQARSDYVSKDKAKETFIETTRALGRALSSDCKLSRFQNFVNFCLRHVCLGSLDISCKRIVQA